MLRWPGVAGFGDSSFVAMAVELGAEALCDAYRRMCPAIVGNIAMARSGLQAIVSAAQAIAMGDCDIAIGAGSKSMSRSAP